tara:strand:- start:92 stop:661 length:570 start_codon:yes stop_codon:yes gene_type:complete
MKTFKEFNIQSKKSLTEAFPALAVPPIVAGIGKGVGLVLTADALRRSAQNLSKGKYKQAAFDAFSAIPAGRVSKVAKYLGAGKKLQNVTKLGQYYNRYVADSAYNKAYSKYVSPLYDPKTYVDVTKKASPIVKKTIDATKQNVKKGIDATKQTTSKIVNKTKETVKPLLKKDNLKKGVKVLYKAARRIR